jgi:hypothetical protein
MGLGQHKLLGIWPAEANRHNVMRSIGIEEAQPSRMAFDAVGQLLLCLGEEDQIIFGGDAR